MLERSDAIDFSFCWVIPPVLRFLVSQSVRQFSARCLECTLNRVAGARPASTSTRDPVTRTQNDAPNSTVIWNNNRESSRRVFIRLNISPSSSSRPEVTMDQNAATQVTSALSTRKVTAYRAWTTRGYLNWATEGGGSVEPTAERC